MESVKGEIVADKRTKKSNPINNHTSIGKCAHQGGGPAPHKHVACCCVDKEHLLHVEGGREQHQARVRFHPQVATLTKGECPRGHQGQSHQAHRHAMVVETVASKQALEQRFLCRSLTPECCEPDSDTVLRSKTFTASVS